MKDCSSKECLQRGILGHRQVKLPSKLAAIKPDDRLPALGRLTRSFSCELADLSFSSSICQGIYQLLKLWLMINRRLMCTITAKVHKLNRKIFSGIKLHNCIGTFHCKIMRRKYYIPFRDSLTRTFITMFSKICLLFISVKVTGKGWWEICKIHH